MMILWTVGGSYCTRHKQGLEVVSLTDSSVHQSVPTWKLMGMV